MDTIDFTWAVSPPDPVNGQVVKSGDVQKLPRAQAERYAAAGYGRLGKPGKPDKPVHFTLRFDEHQIWGQMNLKAGQTIQAPSIREARRMELAGRGSIGTELKPHVHDQPTIDRFNREEAQRNHRPEFDPKPNTGAIRSRYAAAHNFAREGWLGV